MKLIKGFTVLMIFLVVGNTLANYIPLPVPGNLIGMLLILGCLVLGILPLELVEEASEFLLSKMAILFIPAGVGIVNHFTLLQAAFIPIVVGTLLSTLMVLVVTAKCAAYLLREKTKEEG